MAPKQPAVDDLRAALSPGTLVAGKTLKVDITSPSDVDDLVLSVVEVDTGEDEEKKGKDSVVATFYGRVASNAFELVERKAKGKGKPPPNPEFNSKPGKKPSMIKIALGGATYDAPLPGRDSENGIYELRVTMSAKGHKNFRSDTTVYVRDFQFYKSKDIARPVIAILVATDAPASNNGFGKAALKFWKHHADAVFDRKTGGLELAMKFLDKYKDKFGKWGEVNLINHGNMVPMFTKLFTKNDQEFLDGHKIDELIADPKRDPEAFKAGVGLDKKSRIVFRACDAGNNPKIMEALHKKVFASACPVHIPKLVQVYRNDGGGEWFEEMLLYYHVSKTKPSAAVVEKKMKEIFEERYPKAEWNDEKGTFKPHGDPNGRQQKLGVFFERHEQVLYSDLDTGARKKEPDLKTELEQHWKDKNLEQDDRYWLTNHDGWHAERRNPGKRKMKEEKTDQMWVEVSVPKGGKASPKIMIKRSGKVSIGSGSGNDIVITAPGVAANHAEVDIQKASSDDDAFDLSITAVDRGLDMIAGKRFPIPAGGTGTATRGVTLAFGKTIVNFRLAQILWLEYDLYRYMVQRRRTFKTFDGAKPYKDRDVVQPTLTNPDHFGKFG